MTGSAPIPVHQRLVRGIVFLATPHTGAGLATAVDYARKFYRATPVVKALRLTIRIRPNSRTGSASLTTMRTQLVKLRSYRETVPVKGLVMVVDEEREPGCQGRGTDSGTAAGPHRDRQVPHEG